MTCLFRRSFGVPAGAALALLLVAAAPAFAQRNERAARVLAMFDINNAGGSDQSLDSDGDGLPDTWEVGGVDPEGTDVPFPAPEAIVPGTPPTPLFLRRVVRTSATRRDSDSDGLSDFVEVFGLKFIDDDGDGILDDACARDGAGNVIYDANGSPRRAVDGAGNPIGEWFDVNNDGMPSIGELPATNVLIGGAARNFDFDGFIFTDPANPDTDGDGFNDRVDVDPLINPRAFGIAGDFFPSPGAPNDRDADDDGLGNGMDLGNDANQVVDNPSDLQRVIELFRGDLGTDNVRVPEGLVEDLLGADWNGDGLFSLTDIDNPHFGVTSTDDSEGGPVPAFDLNEDPRFEVAGVQLFRVTRFGGDDGDPNDQEPLGYAEPRSGGRPVNRFPENFDRNTYFDFAQRTATNRYNPPLPWQELLFPASRDAFLPDVRVWTVLYSWRMPGFDIDGNGFIGFDGKSFSGRIDVNGDTDFPTQSTRAPSSEIRIADQSSVFDGVIDSPFNFEGCGCAGLGGVALAVVGMWGSGSQAGLRRRRQRRQQRPNAR